jgi:archaeosine-15-forming tRNA-guanine transglycosylase
MGTSKRWLWAILIGAVFMLLAWLVLAYQQGTVATDITVSELITLAREGRVQKIIEEEQSFTVILWDGTRRVGAKGDEDLRHVLQQAGVVNVDALFQHR